jgi:hypothetical protein
MKKEAGCPTFYKAILDSWNFHFEAYAENETFKKGIK